MEWKIRLSNEKEALLPIRSFQMVLFFTDNKPSTIGIDFNMVFLQSTNSIGDGIKIAFFAKKMPKIEEINVENSWLKQQNSSLIIQKNCSNRRLTNASPL